MKIKIFYGTSGSGKTTYIINEILKSKTEDIEEEGLKFSVGNNFILFGHYNIDKRCKGCDTLSMSAIDEIIRKLIQIIKEDKFDFVVLDGDRVNNNKMLEFIKTFKTIVDFEIYWLNTSIDTIYKRIPSCNKTFVQTTKTKTENMISKLRFEGFDIIEIKEERKEWW